MTEINKYYDRIAEEMDAVATEDLPSDREMASVFALRAKEAGDNGAEALKQIDAYTRYVCNRTYAIVKPPTDEEEKRKLLARLRPDELQWENPFD